MKDHLQRFLDAQENHYQNALTEIGNEHKTTHWMWFIFPQLKGLGRTEYAQYYGISGIEEATAYLANPVLGERLLEICHALFKIHDKTAHEIFGSPDDIKLRSSLTLFANVEGANRIFEQLIEKYFGAEQDQKTLELLGA